MRSNRSALKVEALEQRQLLATIVAGSGENVDNAQNVKLANGNTYDQVLMTGATLTVGADTVDGVHQVTRVDFLDADGDIVRAEFSGAGSLKIDLAGFKDAATPAEYNLPDLKYVQGTATFTIVGSDETTNFSVFSLGSANVHNGANNPMFSGKDGGNNWANVQALVIQDNGSVLGNAFGRIGAGNAIFSGDTGAVGVLASKIQFQGDIIIGDIDAKGTSSAQLKLGEFSANKTVTVAGGDLDQTTGVLNTANVSKLISQSGSTSFGVITNTAIIHADAGIGADNITYKSSAEKVTINGQEATQAELDVYKTKFLNEVEITGGLKSGLTFAALMIGNVTVGGDLAGLITTDVDGGNDSDSNELSIGNVTIDGNIVKGGAIEASTSIGNVTVSGGIDLDDVNSALDTAKSAAFISAIGRAGFSNKIGDVTFGKEVDLDNENAPLIVAASAAATSGGIGNVSITGNLTSTGVATVISTAKGGIGNITVTGDVSTGAISAAAGIGNIEGKSLALGALTGGTEAIGTITSKDGNITLAAVTTAKALGAITSDGAVDLTGAISAKSIGNITASDGTLDTDATITATDGNIGDISSKGNMTLDFAVNAKGTIGAISVTGTGNLTIAGILGTDDGVDNTLNNADDVTTTSIGNISVAKGDLTINETIQAKSIGNISVAADGATGGTLTVAAGKNVNAYDGSIGTITVTGAEGTDNTKNAGIIVFADNASQIKASKGIGDITVTRGYITGVANSIEFTANTIGNVSVTARADATVMQEYLLSDVAFVAAGTTEATVGSAKIGNITLNSSANADGHIAAGEAADDTNDGTGFSSSGSIGNITLTTADGGKLLSANTASLLFRAGSAGMGANDAADTYAGGVDQNGGVAIGTVSIKTDLSQPLSDTTTVGTGLVIASGVNLAANGVFASGVDGVGVDDAVLAAPAKMGSGNTIGAVVLEDLSGNVTNGGFVSATLQAADDNAFAASSVIIADQISSVSLKTGAGTVLDLTGLNGLPLKGVIGMVQDTPGEFTTTEQQNLFVVVL